MVALDATVYPAEAYVLVQTDWLGIFFQDTFTRVQTDSWGTPDVGPAYAISAGAAANFDVNGVYGTTTHTAVNTSNFITSAVNMADINFTGQFTNTVTPTGDNFEWSAFGRFADLANYVRAIVFLNAAGTVTCVIEHANGGVFTVSSFLAIPGLPTTGVYRFRLVEQGPSILFRAWMAGTPEPQVWHNTFTATRLVAGNVGIGTKVAAGVTNPLPVIFQWDDLLAFDPSAPGNDCAIVTRRNTVTGEVVNLRPYISFNGDGALLLECGQGLWWDTEPPLNVALEYCAVACDVATTVSANPDFDSSTAGWTTANGATLAQDCTVAKVGTCSGRITPNGTTTNPTIQQTTGALAADREIMASGWVMSPQGWNSVLLRVTVTYTDLTSEILETEYVTLDDNEWRFLELSFTPAQAVNSVTLAFIGAGLVPNTTLFHVDDLKVTQLADVAATDCETVTVASESVWLKSPLHPCDDIEIGLCSPMLEDCDDDSRVSYVGTFDDSYAPNTALLAPVNRKRPIAVSRQRRDAAATLRLLAHDCDAKDAVLQINDPGDPLLFQAPEDYCIPDRYISVETVSEGKIGVDQREDFRLMTLPYVVVDRPEGPMDGPCGARFEDLCDIYTSWAALTIAGLTWEDLLLGEASPNGPGQPEPPEGARTWGDVESGFVSWLAVEAGGTRDWGELRDGL